MNSSQDILNMIATEAVEGNFRHPNIPERRLKRKGEKELVVDYRLRVVKKKNGELVWED